MYADLIINSAITEVELDTLTGDSTVLRTDLMMDIGRSINPALDYGQIEGAFVQGQGLFTMEESLWTKSGELFTKGPGTYKIPGEFSHKLRALWSILLLLTYNRLL